MRKALVFTVLLVILSACNSTESYMYWTDESENQILRLDDANIKYEIQEGEIWIREKDLNKVVACCS